MKKIILTSLLFSAQALHAQSLISPYTFGGRKVVTIKKDLGDRLKLTSGHIVQKSEAQYVLENENSAGFEANEEVLVETSVMGLLTLKTIDILSEDIARLDDHKYVSMDRLYKISNELDSLEYCVDEYVVVKQGVNNSHYDNQRSFGKVTSIAHNKNTNKTYIEIDSKYWAESERVSVRLSKFEEFFAKSSIIIKNSIMGEQEAFITTVTESAIQISNGKWFSIKEARKLVEEGSWILL